MKRQPERGRAPERPPSSPGRIRAVFLAVLVHAAFFALIVFGVTWQSSPTAPVVAELWEKLPPAPKAAPKPPQPEPAKPPETKAPEPPKPEPPEAKPEPPKPEPPPEAKPEPPKPDPALVKKLEREKRDKQRREKLEQDKREKQKEEAAKKKREEQEAAKKKREEEKRRAEEERARQEADRQRQAAAAARQKEVDEWTARIQARIRGRANVPDTVTGHPEVQVHIRILPGGEVLDISVTKRSGNPTYDAAIERAIRSASPLPVPQPNSELFPLFRELNLNIRHER